LWHIWMSSQRAMSHVNASWHIRMSCDTYEWVVTHMNEFSKSNVTCECVLTHTNETNLDERQRLNHQSDDGEGVSVIACTCGYDMLHLNESRCVWMSHVASKWVMACTNEADLDAWPQKTCIYIRIMSPLSTTITSHTAMHLVMSYTNESWHVRMRLASMHVGLSESWVIRLPRSRVKSVQTASCLIRMSRCSCEWVMSHMSESRLIVMSHWHIPSRDQLTHVLPAYFMYISLNHIFPLWHIKMHTHTTYFIQHISPMKYSSITYSPHGICR